MEILYGFIAVNLLLVLASLIVRARRRSAATGPSTAAAAAKTARGPVNSQWTVQNDILGVGAACDHLRDFLESQGVPIKELFDLTAILEEMLSFVLSRDLPEGKRCAIGIAATIQEGTVTLELRYDGKGCNPLEAPAIDLSKPLEEITLDGMDIHLLRHFSDGLDYRSQGRQCLFTATKKLTANP
jgi:anti-sigma regulatory factor (Ser/Thr protein kinase)